MVDNAKKATSFRLNQEALFFIERLSKKLEITRTRVVELALEQMAQAEKVQRAPFARAAAWDPMQDLRELNEEELDLFLQKALSVGNLEAFEIAKQECESRGKGHIPDEIEGRFPDLSKRMRQNWDNR